MPSPGVDVVFFSYKENVGLLRIMFKIVTKEIQKKLQILLRIHTHSVMFDLTVF